MFKKHPHRSACVGEHRSGWDYVRSHLAAAYTADGIILDDFVERTFLYDDSWHNNHVYTEPWVGIAHHAPDIPSWYMDKLQLWDMVQSHRWLESLPQLKMLVTMAPNLQRWFKTHYPQLPVVCIKHPTGRPLLEWTPARFTHNQEKLLLQVGWFCRNTGAIYQVDTPADFFLRKGHLRQAARWIGYTELLCQTSFRTADYNRGRTIVLEPQGNADYDHLLAKNVVFIEVITAVANNTVVECIARNTPIVINRHPGPAFYLGEEYPLFYDDIQDVPKLLTLERILEAHYYLRQLDKTWIRGRCFVESLLSSCELHGIPTRDRLSTDDALVCV